MARLTAIVTAATQAIGKQVAVELARNGLDIVVAASSVRPHRGLSGPVGETVEEIRASGGNAIGVETDVRSPVSVAGLLAKAVDAFGGVDVLINGASDTSGGTPVVTELDMADWQRQFDIT